MSMKKGQVTAKVAWRQLVQRAIAGESILELATVNGELDKYLYLALRAAINEAHG